MKGVTMKIIDKMKQLFFNKEQKINKKEVEAIQELNDLEKNTKKDLETERTYDEIKAQEDEGENEVRYVQADMLPEGWMWEIFDDASGGLISPTGKSYFSFDWNTYEYKLNENSGYDYFGNRDDMGNELTFKDFMKYAENYAKDKLVNLAENQKESKDKKEEVEAEEVL